MIKKKLERTIYYHDCKVMGCRVLKDNKNSCQFCGRKKWRVYLKIYSSGEQKKPTFFEKLSDKLKNW